MTTEENTTLQAASRPSAEGSRRWRRFVSSLAVGACLSVLAFFAYSASGLHVARERSEGSEWAEAQSALDRYLRIFPENAEANLLMAEAVVRGNTASPRAAAERALRYLQRVPETSRFAAEARMREGRMRFLILHQLEQAEAQFHRAVELNADDLDSHYLLWQIFVMTERYDESEPHFWEVYRLTHEADRPYRLREWYLSQFHPWTASAPLDRRMGFLEPDQLPDAMTQLNRLQAFRAAEPDAITPVAAVGAWCLEEHKYELAVEILDSSPLDEAVLQNDFYMAVRIDALIKLGRFEAADELYTSWNGSPDDYDFAKMEGTIMDVVRSDNAAAIEAYDRALAIWPGHVDWPMRHRKAQCLARSGDDSAAQQVRDRAKEIELLMEPDVHERLRTALGRLDDPQSLRLVEGFYRSIDRLREAEAWNAVIQRLEEQHPLSPDLFSRPGRSGLE